MNFDAIKAGCLAILCGMPESGHNAGQFIIAQFPRDFVRLLPLWRVRFVVGDPQGTRRDGLCSVVEQ